MKPYATIGNVTLYHGDCREVLPYLAPFRLLLTDPPFGIKRDGHRGGLRPDARGSTRQRHKAYETRGWDGEREEEALAMAVAACKDAIVWGGNYYPLPPSRGWIVWGKGQDGDLDAGDAELAWTSFDRVVRVCTLHRVHLWKENPQHPTQKPTALMGFCLNYARAEAGGTILDPFAGSGTTGVAAFRLGLSCTLIEREEAYCEIAARRLSAEPEPLFPAAAPAPEQAEMFAHA